MNGVVDRSSEARLALDMWRAERAGPAGLAGRRDRRLAGLLRYARARSPLYRRQYRGLPDGPLVLGELPPLTKPELMAAFDEWVTDPRVTRAAVEAFVADPARVGTPFLGSHFVCTSSGTTGEPGLFVHDARAVAVNRAIVLRVDRAWLSPAQWLGAARKRARWAVVVGTGGHFAGAGWPEFERRQGRFYGRGYRVFSVQRPLAELVAALNAFDPAILTAYPSAMALLAEEQQAGRLRVRPVVAEVGGESSLPGDQARMAGAFGCPVREVYGSSEFNLMAFACEHQWLHVSSDWVILEPVAADLTPVPPGMPSHTVLLTNLANRVQPIVRYDLGDSVLARPDPCSCGNPLPAIRVAGRRDDVLCLAAPDGWTVRVLPLAIGTVVDETPGVHRSQLLQVGESTIRLRLDVRAGADVEQVWGAVTTSLRGFLAAQGLGNVTLVRGAEPPERSARSGKFRQVIAHGATG